MTSMISMISMKSIRQSPGSLLLLTAGVYQAYHEEWKDENDGNDGDANVRNVVTHSQNFPLLLCSNFIISYLYDSPLTTPTSGCQHARLHGHTCLTLFTFLTEKYPVTWVSIASLPRLAGSAFCSSVGGFLSEIKCRNINMVSKQLCSY